MNAKDKRDLVKAIDSLKKQKSELDARYQTLKSSNAKIEKRKFATENPEQSLKSILVSYENIKDMADEDIFQKKTEYKNQSFAKGYISLIKMYKSLGEDGGYIQEENETFKSALDSIKVQVEAMNPKHRDSFIQSFDDLDNCIRNYRFA